MLESHVIHDYDNLYDLLQAISEVSWCTNSNNYHLMIVGHFQTFGENTKGCDLPRATFIDMNPSYYFIHNSCPIFLLLMNTLSSWERRKTKFPSQWEIFRERRDMSVKNAKRKII